MDKLARQGGIKTALMQGQRSQGDGRNMRGDFVKPAILVISILAALPTAALAAPVTVTVHGVASGKGKLYVSLCSKAEFLGRCSISRAVPAKRGKVVVAFPKVLPGDYGFSAFHDENGNGILDRGAFGIPKEGYGFGRNAVGDRGPPKFEATVEKIPAAGRRVEFGLRY